MSDIGVDNFMNLCSTFGISDLLSSSNLSFAVFSIIRREEDSVETVEMEEVLICGISEPKPITTFCFSVSLFPDSFM